MSDTERSLWYGTGVGVGMFGYEPWYVALLVGAACAAIMRGHFWLRGWLDHRFGPQSA